MQIAGLNAPIPPGASFGYQPGGWGKPPVDETGKALYGDVFGQHVDDAESDEEYDKAVRWGELDPEEEESEEESEEEEEMEGRCFWWEELDPHRTRTTFTLHAHTHMNTQHI